MSRLVELVKSLCPTGVPYRQVQEVTDRGTNIRWADVGLREFGYIDLASVDRVTRRIRVSETISAETAPSRAQQIVRTGDVIFATTRPAQLRWAVITPEHDGQIASTGYCVIRPHAEVVLPSFLAHLLGTDAFRQYVETHQVAGNYPSISDVRVREYRIPVPPLEVQREIAELLDELSGLGAELEAELEAEREARRLQYVHHRDELVLAGYEAGEPRSMGELASIARGASPRPIQTYLTDDPRGIPWIKIGDATVGAKFITNTAQRITKEGAGKSRTVFPGDFVLSNSMSFGRPYISKIEGCIHDGWLSISGFEKNFLPDYLYHLLSSTPVQRDFSRRVGSSTVSNLNTEIVKATIVPRPTLSDQAQIIEVLDKFDFLVNGLSTELPAELAARRKQYEYYRDRLLTFEEAPA